MQRGHTLAELLVVIAIMALLAGASIPALGAWLDGESTVEESVAALLRHARRTALETGRPVMLSIDPARGDWVVDAAGDVRERGHLDLDGGEVVSAGPRLSFRFAPSGASSGQPICVRAEPGIRCVRADRWTGRIEITDA